MAMITPSRFPRGTQTPAVRGNAADYIPPGILSFSRTGFFMVRISKVKHRSHLSQMAWLETSFGRCCIWLDNSGYIPAEAAYTSHEEGCGMELASGKPKFTWKSLVGLLVVTLGLAGLSGFLTRDSMDVYQTLNLPSFAPPGWAFPVAWGILYPVMVADAAQQYGECAAHSAAVWSAVACQCDLAAAVFLTASLGVVVCLVAAGFRPGIGDVHPLFQEQPMGWRPYGALSGVVGLCGCTELFHSKAQPAVTRAHFQAIPVFQRDALAFVETIQPIKGFPKCGKTLLCKQNHCFRCLQRRCAQIQSEGLRPL